MNANDAQKNLAVKLADYERCHKAWMEASVFNEEQRTRAAPFEIIRHKKDVNGRAIVDIQGIVLSNLDAIKLRDELIRLDLEAVPRMTAAEQDAFPKGRY